MEINVDKFEIAMECLEATIENTKEDMKRIQRRIDECRADGDFTVSHIYTIELHNIKLKLASLENTYNNFKESIKN